MFSALDGVRRLSMNSMKTLTESDMAVWLATKEMGFALAAERDELTEAKDDLEGKPTGRWIAPHIDKFLRKLKVGEESIDMSGGQGGAGVYAEALTILEDWGGPIKRQ